MLQRCLGRFVLVVGLLVGAQAGAASEDAELTKLVFRQLSQFKAVRQGLSMRCISLMTFEFEGKWASAVVREKHDRKCGGDPGVAPRLATLWVDRQAKRVFVETLEGDKVPIERYRTPE